MTFAEPDGRCRLCGHADRRDIRLTLVHWGTAPIGMAYEHVPTCIDRDACRERCQAGGDKWPLFESEEVGMTAHEWMLDIVKGRRGAGLPREVRRSERDRPDPASG